MDEYTIYCTPEQIKRALEFGAPIYTTTEHLYNHPHEYKYWVEVDIQGNHYAAKIHTAEQMIGWLEDKGVTLTIQYFSSIRKFMFFCVSKEGEYNSRKEATRAAIDAALEYLSNNK